MIDRRTVKAWDKVHSNIACLYPNERVRLLGSIEELITGTDAQITQWDDSDQLAGIASILSGAPVVVEMIVELPCPHLPRLMDCEICYGTFIERGEI